MSATAEPGPAGPAARPGLVDRFLGPGHTGSDLLAQGLGGLVCIGLLGWYLATSPAGPGGSSWHLALLAVIGVDLVGGILTNSTTAAKAWYHRPAPHARRTRLAFVSSHLVHLGLVGLVLLDGDRAWVTVNAALLLGAAALIEFSPRPAKRVVAAGAYAAVLMLGLILVPLPEALAWFPALFYLKLLVCFLVPDSVQPPERLP